MAEEFMITGSPTCCHCWLRAAIKLHARRNTDPTGERIDLREAFEALAAVAGEVGAQIAVQHPAEFEAARAEFERVLNTMLSTASAAATRPPLTKCH